jgi:hypothetical protein
MSITVDRLVELALEMENGDPIDWGMIPVKEEDAYRKMAEQVVEMMKSYNPADRQTIALAAITKLLVENFVLNYQLASGLSKAV